MNDFGVNLRGYRGIMKGKTFYKYTMVKGVIKPCPEKERIFVFESGKGLEPDGSNRNIFGHFEHSGFKGTIDNYSLEAVIAPDGTVIKVPVISFTDETKPAPVAAKDPEAEPAPSKLVRRKRC